MWGATTLVIFPRSKLAISIHAPRGGSDCLCIIAVYAVANFNPRSPWGERLALVDIWTVSPGNFNPRSPWGERLAGINVTLTASEFQSTLPVGGATLAAGDASVLAVISIHAPRGGSDELIL